MKGAWLPLIISKIYKKKFILRCGYEYYRFSTFYNQNFIKVLIIYLFSYLSYKLSNKIVITNNYEKNFIIQKFNLTPRKIKVIPNFIDTNIFKKKNITKNLTYYLLGGLNFKKI